MRICFPPFSPFSSWVRIIRYPSVLVSLGISFFKKEKEPDIKPIPRIRTKKKDKIGPIHFFISYIPSIAKVMAGDAGVEPTTFGSGDQRSIQLS